MTDPRVCVGCGKRFADRARNPDDAQLWDPWITAFLCAPCCEKDPPRMMTLASDAEIAAAKSTRED